MNVEVSQPVTLVIFVALYMIGVSLYVLKLIRLSRDANRTERPADLKRIERKEKLATRIIGAFMVLVTVAWILSFFFLF